MYLQYDYLHCIFHFAALAYPCILHYPPSSSGRKYTEECLLFCRKFTCSSSLPVSSPLSSKYSSISASKFCRSSMGSDKPSLDKDFKAETTRSCSHLAAIVSAFAAKNKQIDRFVGDSVSFHKIDFTCSDETMNNFAKKKVGMFKLYTKKH